MNQNKSKNWIYFLVLLVLAVGFVTAGYYLVNKKSDTPSSELVTEAIEKERNDSTPEADLSPDQKLYASGIRSLDVKDYQSAIDSLAQAIAKNPNNTSYYSLKSEAEYLAGKKEDAKATLEAGLKIDPSNELLNSKLDVLTKDYFQSSSFDATRE